MSSSSPDTDTAPPCLPPSMRLPNELLDEVFQHVFAEPEHEPLRDRVRVYAPLTLVCKTWRRVVMTHAYAEVVVDVAQDSDATAFLDPVGGAGTHLLSLVKAVKLSTSRPLIKIAPMGDGKAEDAEEEEGKEEVEGENSDAPPAHLSPILHGPADDETSSLPIVSSVARILAKCSNLSALTVDQHFGLVLCKVTANRDPTFTWPKLMHLSLTWDDSFIDLLPVLACLSQMQQLTSLCLLLGASHEYEDPRGTMTQELVDKHPVQPLERLQRFVIAVMAETPTGSQAVLQLLSPRAPLQHVTWAGYVPPGLCKQLSRGTTEIKDLTFMWMLPTRNLANQLLPQLLELGRRPVQILTLNMSPVLYAPRTESMPPITAVFQDFPHGIRVSSSTAMDPSSSELSRGFPTGGADFAAINSVAMGMEDEWSESFKGKPLLQVVMFHVEKESADDLNLRFFGRFGNPDIEGDVTGWMLLKIAAREGDKEE